MSNEITHTPVNEADTKAAIFQPDRTAEAAGVRRSYGAG